MSTSLNLAHSFLLKLEPERAHEISLMSLEQGFFPHRQSPDDPRLAQSLLRLRFPNPIGVAAGFDKDGRVPMALLQAGFGFAEVGTVTPEPQEGNPRPRVFRLIDDRAIVNRLGFNSAGHAAVLARLENRPAEGVIGVNIGANRDSEDRVADYVTGLETFAGIADYFTVNVSSPNTPGLRELQAPDALDRLLHRIMDARHRLLASGYPRRPVLVKLSPDIPDADLEAVVETILRHRLEGIIVSNTTVARDGVSDAGLAREDGGLSGPPLFARSTRMLARVHLLTEGAIPLIGVGGIDSAARAIDKMEAGASLLQLYTGLVYEGPTLLGRITQGLAEHLDRIGAESVADIVGTQAPAWADWPGP